MTTKADTYRQKAEDCLRSASCTSDLAGKAMWLEMAQQWMLIATSREQRTAAANNDRKPDAEDESRDGSSRA